MAEDLTGLLAGECELSNGTEDAKPANNPESAPSAAFKMTGEVQHPGRDNTTVSGGDESATDGTWDQAVGLHG